MQPTSPPAGWYPDPAGGPTSRWWDGQAWSASAAPMGAAPVNAAPVSAAPVPQAHPYGYPVPPQNAYPPQGAPARAGNGLAFTAIGISVAYVALATFVHFVFLGIVPILMAFRSRNRREPLAPVAIGVAVIGVVVSIYFLTRR